MTLTRRDWLRLTAGGGAALALTPDLLASLARQEVHGPGHSGHG